MRTLKATYDHLWRVTQYHKSVSFFWFWFPFCLLSRHETLILEVTPTFQYPWYHTRVRATRKKVYAHIPIVLVKNDDRNEPLCGSPLSQLILSLSPCPQGDRTTVSVLEKALSHLSLGIIWVQWWRTTDSHVTICLTHMISIIIKRGWHGTLIQCIKDTQWFNRRCYVMTQ